jgi:hypothetical protein
MQNSVGEIAALGAKETAGQVRALARTGTAASSTPSGKPLMKKYQRNATTRAGGNVQGKVEVEAMGALLTDGETAQSIHSKEGSRIRDNNVAKCMPFVFRNEPSRGEDEISSWKRKGKEQPREK